MKSTFATQEGAPATPDNEFSFATQAATEFRALILQADFPCLGAKSALHGDSFNLRCFSELGGRQATRELAAALLEFTRSQEAAPSQYATFVAIFQGPRDLTEIDFERLLWQQLRELHDHDVRAFEWDPAVSADPVDPHFSFSFGGHALYVIGLHANSSRKARQFPWPVLVFNPHEQFEQLRAGGKWRRMQESIRQRDLALQGSTNPMLSDFGERSEARQYSGRAVGENWRAPFPASAGKCPFHH